MCPGRFAPAGTRWFRFLQIRCVLCVKNLCLAVHSAAAVYHLSGDISCEVACEEEGYIGHIFRRSSSAHRDLLLPFLAHVFRQRACHICRDEARCYAVCTDAARAHLLGDRFGEADKAGLDKSCFQGKKIPAITAATLGRVVDYGITDVNNMGAAMATAAADTILTHLQDMERDARYYDLIVTGDLGALGSRLMKDLLWEKGVDVEPNHVDCGEIIYNVIEDEFQGGSGAGCSAVVFGSYLYDKLKKGEIRRMLFAATGALLSTVSSGQGESIPCISHAVSIEIDV